VAQKVQTLLTDDIDGGEAEGTVRFGLDGTSSVTALPWVWSRRWPRRPARSGAHGLGAARSAQGHLPFVQIAGIGSPL